MSDNPRPPTLMEELQARLLAKKRQQQEPPQTQGNEESDEARFKRIMDDPACWTSCGVNRGILPR